MQAPVCSAVNSAVRPGEWFLIIAVHQTASEESLWKARGLHSSPRGFDGSVVKSLACQHRIHRSNPWVRKTP